MEGGGGGAARAREGPRPGRLAARHDRTLHHRGGMLEQPAGESMASLVEGDDAPERAGGDPGPVSLFVFDWLS